MTVFPFEAQGGQNEITECRGISFVMCGGLAVRSPSRASP
jgi:hypothetical protein